MLNLLNDPSIPTVGQALTVDGYTIAISARCHCETGGTFVLMAVNHSAVGDAVIAGVCPRCKQGYSVQGMELDQNAHLRFNVAVLSSTPPSES